MLPVFIYEPNDKSRHEYIDALGDGVEIRLSTTAPGGLVRAVEGQDSLMLAILGVHANNSGDCVDLSSLIQERNRDNYTMLCIHRGAPVAEVLSACMRPAGVLIEPWTGDALRACIQRIMRDYESLGGSEDYLEFEAESSAYRLRLDDILYLEAVNKKLNICTKRRRITVRCALSALEEKLPEHFLRIHRAFIVNTRAIDRVDYTDPIVTLTNGETIPVARARKDALRDALARKEVRS